jgi:hypothetical protein
VSKDETPSLFDDQVDPESWDEVPQDRFLSWPIAMQLVYCAARDADAALNAETLAEAEWYCWRASCYRAMVTA